MSLSILILLAWLQLLGGFTVGVLISILLHGPRTRWYRRFIPPVQVGVLISVATLFGIVGYTLSPAVFRPGISPAFAFEFMMWSTFITGGIGFAMHLRAASRNLAAANKTTERILFRMDRHWDRLLELREAAQRLSHADLRELIEKTATAFIADGTAPTPPREP